MTLGRGLSHADWRRRIFRRASFASDFILCSSGARPSLASSIVIPAADSSSAHLSAVLSDARHPGLAALPP